MKNPWLKFYTRDWKGKAKLRACSLAARGLWIEMLCVMHEAEPYGHLAVNGVRIADETLAGVVGSTGSVVKQALAELEKFHVFSRTPDGVIYSRRMVDDEKRRQTDKDNGKRGGNPKLMSGVNPPDSQGGLSQNLESRIQNLDSSFLHKLEPEEPKPKSRAPSRFDEFWAEYPQRDGTNSKTEAKKRFDSLVAGGADPEEIIAGTKRYHEHCQQRGKLRTEFVMQSTTFLNKNIWKKESVSAPPVVALVAQTDYRGFTTDQWALVMRLFRATGTWHQGKHGPEPGLPGCAVPRALLNEEEIRSAERLGAQHAKAAQSL